MISEMKQVGHALLEFDVEYGGFPSDAIAPEVAEATGTDEHEVL